MSRFGYSMSHCQAMNSSSFHFSSHISFTFVLINTHAFQSLRCFKNFSFQNLSRFPEPNRASQAILIVLVLRAVHKVRYQLYLAPAFGGWICSFR